MLAPDPRDVVANIQAEAEPSLIGLFFFNLHVRSPERFKIQQSAYLSGTVCGMAPTLFQM